MTRIEVPNIAELNNEKERQNAMIHAEMRRISGELYIRLASEYLATIALGERPSTVKLRHLSWMAVKSAPYHHLACGLVTNIDESEHWNAAS